MSYWRLVNSLMSLLRFYLLKGARLSLVDILSTVSPVQLDHDLKHAHELRQAAFKLYASLGSNDEDIRKKVTFSYVCIFLCLCMSTHAPVSPATPLAFADHRDREHDGQDSQWPIRIQHQSPLSSCQVWLNLCAAPPVLL